MCVFKDISFWVIIWMTNNNTSVSCVEHMYCRVNLLKNVVYFLIKKSTFHLLVFQCWVESKHNTWWAFSGCLAASSIKYFPTITYRLYFMLILAYFGSSNKQKVFEKLILSWADLFLKDYAWCSLPICLI
jgi:hypothetical protein